MLILQLRMAYLLLPRHATGESSRHPAGHQSSSSNECSGAYAADGLLMASRRSSLNSAASSTRRSLADAYIDSYSDDGSDLDPNETAYVKRNSLDC